MDFSIYYNYGGHFAVSGEDVGYIGGRMMHNFGYNASRVEFEVIEEDLEKLGCTHPYKLFYLLPGMKMSTGLRELQNTHQLLEMLLCIGTNGWEGFFQIFVEGEKPSYEDQSNVQEPTEHDGNLSYVPVMNAAEMNAAEMNAAEMNPPEMQHEESDIDSDYCPVGESETDDGLEDNELSDDEEYIQARNDRVKFKNFRPQPEPVMNVGGRMPSLQSTLPQDINEAYQDTIEGYCSDYDDSEGDMHSITSSHEDFDVFEEGKSEWKKKKKTFYDPLCDAKELKLRLGMRFEHAHQCRDAIVRWAILNGHNIKTIRSWKWQLEMKCEAECPWNLYGSIIREEQNFVIKRYNGQHLCSRTMENRQATCTWIATEYKDRFRRDPNWAPKHLELDLLEKFCLKVSKWKCYRAKWGALDMLRGSVFEHYACLRSYKAELMRVDREGRFDFLVGDNCAFKGFFIGFSGLIKGFREGCRPVIGFDGCFLETFLGGALLCAVAKDGNNQMFPICWAVVESENEYYWTWFLQILFEELGIVDGIGWSFMSDQQKGLINAIANLTPHAEHRNCARHVYCNWKKEFKGQTLKNMFWRVARSTYEAAAKINLDAMKAENSAAHDDFIHRDPKKFCKLYMSTRPKSDMIDNNVCETFNGYIVKARAMHIIEMLEEIRCALMQRFHTKLTATDKRAKQKELRLVRQGYGCRIFEGEGRNIYTRDPGTSRSKFIHGDKAIAKAARETRQTPASCTTDAPGYARPTASSIGSAVGGRDGRAGGRGGRVGGRGGGRGGGKGGGRGGGRGVVPSQESVAHG